MSEFSGAVVFLPGIAGVLIYYALRVLFPVFHLDRMDDETVRGHGFEYAYQYPGFGKVLQAAGRVHRTEYDKGVILLIDERFTRPDYYRLFPEEYADAEIVDERTIGSRLEEFWKGTV